METIYKVTFPPVDLHSIVCLVAEHWPEAPPSRERCGFSLQACVQSPHPAILDSLSNLHVCEARSTPLVSLCLLGQLEWRS